MNEQAVEAAVENDVPSPAMGEFEPVKKAKEPVPVLATGASAGKEDAGAME